MSDEIKVCSVPVFSEGVESSELYLVGLTAYLWIAGMTLRVRFLDGEPIVQKKVEVVAHQWSQFANIKFQFGNDLNAEIRISFTRKGSWSMLGTDALLVNRDEPTMNFGWLKADSPDEEYSRVVLHEFGHALGFTHEHKHPESGIKWNREAVIDYYRRTNGWNEDATTRNVLQAESKDRTQYSAFDRESIMLYAIPAELTTDGFSTGWNTQLSATDKQFAQRLYPGTPPGAKITTILYVRPFDGRTFGPVTSSQVVSEGDGWRGWSWDGSTASYLAVDEKRQTWLYVRPFDSRTFGPVTSSQVVSEGDGWRGWSWDGSTASYLAVDEKRQTWLYVRPFDGQTFGSVTSKQLVSRGDGWRGWSWDGATASYLAVG
ncbi:MAG: hypothetical protein KME07_06155 [Pegethrix bostrychoides GSE-TBD4-15B]|jgi:hypothetical protein|uniref:Peptidase metallopeptidase domain-containing protein n=1 Tax=Pegethrix bostrychoides GSE-TBD4-15B TaxID=2839662 RepID=A0A951PAD3_9CYAN|nr:hypothetical protein [Pegethrix bostrychoides GSE-TBD4-15B]